MDTERCRCDYLLQETFYRRVDGSDKGIGKDEFRLLVPGLKVLDGSIVYRHGHTAYLHF